MMRRVLLVKVVGNELVMPCRNPPIGLLRKRTHPGTCPGAVRALRPGNGAAVTAPDVRTAARAVAEALWPLGGQLPFIHGAVCGAELVTPTREQIAEAIGGWHFAEHGPGYGEHTEVSRPLALKQADAVLALMNTQTEGENDGG